MKLRFDLNEITPQFGSSLQIAISSNGLALSFCEPDPDLISNLYGKHNITIHTLDFFYDWHLNVNRDELVGVSIYFFAGNPVIAHFDRLMMNHPNVVWEGEGAATIFFTETRPESTVCLCNQDFVGAITKVGDQLLVCLPWPDRFQSWNDH